MQKYNNHILEALIDVKNGQHLRFIKYLYRTKEVCYEAVKYEYSHTNYSNDIYSVPCGNLDYVVDKIKEEYSSKNDYRNRTLVIEDINKAYNKKKENEKQPGYYGNEFNSLQDKLDFYGVKTFDDMLLKMYLQKYS